MDNRGLSGNTPTASALTTAPNTGAGNGHSAARPVAAASTPDSVTTASSICLPRSDARISATPSDPAAVAAKNRFAGAGPAGTTRNPRTPTDATATTSRVATTVTLSPRRGADTAMAVMLTATAAAATTRSHPALPSPAHTKAAIPSAQALKQAATRRLVGTPSSAESTVSAVIGVRSGVG